MIMYWYALIVCSIFRGCGMKSLTVIASMMVDPASIPKQRFFKVYRSSIRDCRPCPLREACFSPNAQRRTARRG